MTYRARSSRVAPGRSSRWPGVPTARGSPPRGWTRLCEIWYADGTRGPTLNGHLGEINSVAWSPDGKRLASASDDSTVRLWSAEGTPGPVLKGHERRVLAVRLEPRWQAAGHGGRGRLRAVLAGRWYDAKAAGEIRFPRHFAGLESRRLAAGRRAISAAYCNCGAATSPPVHP